MENTGQKGISVVFVDDDSAIVNCVAKCLATDFGITTIGFANHAQAGVVVALEKQPDVVLLDIHMPGADAFDACRDIVEKSGGKTRVLFFTGFPRDHYLDRCLASKGSGILSKHTDSLDEIALAIRYVAQGNAYYSREVATRLQAVENKSPASKLATLSVREKEVLRQLGLGRTNREIAINLDIGLRSVEKAVSDVKKKLDLATTNELLIYGANEGVLFPEINHPDSETARMLRGERVAGNGEGEAPSGEPQPNP